MYVQFPFLTCINMGRPSTWSSAGQRASTSLTNKSILSFDYSRRNQAMLTRVVGANAVGPPRALEVHKGGRDKHHPHHPIAARSTIR